MPYLIALLVVGFIFYLIWSGNRSRWQFRVDADSSGNAVVKGFAGVQVATVRDFFRNHVHVDGPITVLASKDDAGLVQTKFNGNLSAGQKQRIRNFLIDIL